MTEKQKDIIIEIFQTGMACGLNHPYEFFVNYIRSFMNFLPYDDIPKAEQDAYDAFIEFMKGTAGHPDEEEWLKTLDADKLNKRINSWYDWAKKHITLKKD